MCATIISFKPGVHRDQALADLQRVQDLLQRSGLNLDTEIGRTEDGDPWVTFCDPETNDVIVNVVLEEGNVVAQGPAFISRVKLQEIEAALRGLLRLMKIDPGISDISRLILPIFFALTALHLSDADASGYWPELGVMNILHTPAVSLITAAALIERVVEAASVVLQDTLGIGPEEQPAAEPQVLELSSGNLTEAELAQMLAADQDPMFMPADDLLVQVEDATVVTAEIPPLLEWERAHIILFSPVDPSPALVSSILLRDVRPLKLPEPISLDIEGLIIIDELSPEERTAVIDQFYAEATSKVYLETRTQWVVYAEGVDESYLFNREDGSQLVLVGLTPQVAASADMLSP
ncbi:hypothetical protein [Devosia sp. 1635]|uniref:hypothetical protein n=1 Tax=Devosia sp. 1635 TaxID=2726066 RepID=UPI0015653315|nr:hypothetical protein [Devosia sp. 1635]